MHAHADQLITTHDVSARKPARIHAALAFGLTGARQGRAEATQGRARNADACASSGTARAKGRAGRARRRALQAERVGSAGWDACTCAIKDPRSAGSIGARRCQRGWGPVGIRTRARHGRGVARGTDVAGRARAGSGTGIADAVRRARCMRATSERTRREIGRDWERSRSEVSLPMGPALDPGSIAGANALAAGPQGPTHLCRPSLL